MLNPRNGQSALETKLDVVITRNAHLIVALRHSTHALHLAGDLGHQRSRRWTQCPHKDCRRVLELIGDTPSEGTGA